jgi:hypothetical protein
MPDFRDIGQAVGNILRPDGNPILNVASAINLAKLIRESYPADISEDLIKRLHRSILSEDDKKFMRKIKELRRSE